MKAAVLGGPGELVIGTKPVPAVGPEDVLVRVHRASLCGTDLKILSRRFFSDGGPPPGRFTPGHEYAGTVVAVGRTVDELHVGQRVVTEAHRGCMRCANCLAGAYTECLNYGVVARGHRAQGMTVDGGFAEYVVNHVSTLHPLDDSVSFDEAVVLTTAGTVMHAFDVLQSIFVGARVAVIGLGPIGLLAVQVARQLGAGTMAAVGNRESRLGLAKQFGADLVVNPREENATEIIRQAMGTHGADIVVECSGAQSAFNDALHIVRRGGRIVLIGFYDQPVTADINDAVMNGVTIHAIRGEGPGAMARALSLASQGRLSTAPLVTHHFGLDQIAEAFTAYRTRDRDAMKVMIDIAGD